LFNLSGNILICKSELAHLLIGLPQLESMLHARYYVVSLEFVDDSYLVPINREAHGLMGEAQR
jgi:hypothetical protein